MKGIFKAFLCTLLLVTFQSNAAQIGDCSSEPGLKGRSDIVLCEPWERADWWQQGYLKSASKTRPQPAQSEDVANATVVSQGCVSGSCLRVNMQQYRGGALAIHWPTNAAGLAPEELYLRYYIRLGENFNPELCYRDGRRGAGNGGKFPGLADVRAFPETQCGNGGAFTDGKSCWSMRSTFRNCFGSGGANVCTAQEGSTPNARFGSYYYAAGQRDGDGTGPDKSGYEFLNAGFWDNVTWGRGRAGCSSAYDGIGDCGIGSGGQLVNGKWYRIEINAKMNTPGQPDGVVRGWVDGVLSYQKTNMMFRFAGHDNLHVRTIWLNIHAGGESVGLCEGSYIMLDQMVAATNGPIGPVGGLTMDTQPPAAPVGVKFN